MRKEGGKGREAEAGEEEREQRQRRKRGMETRIKERELNGEGKEQRSEDETKRMKGMRDEMGWKGSEWDIVNRTTNIPNCCPLGVTLGTNHPTWESPIITPKAGSGQEGKQVMGQEKGYGGEQIMGQEVRKVESQEGTGQAVG